MKSVLVIAAMSILLMGCGFEIVDTGHRGVQTTWGEVNKTSLGEGLHFYNPFSDNVIEMDVRTQRWEFKTPCYTKDIQTAELTAVVNYNLEPAAAPVVLSEIGVDWGEKVVGQDVFDAIKAICGRYDASTFIAERAQAVAQMLEETRRVLGPKHVQVTGLAVTNIDYSDVYERSVEDKAKAEQEAQAEKNRTVKVREIAEQRRIDAMADADAMRSRAAAIRENQGLLEWERLQIQREMIKQWKGQVPQYSFGSTGVVPFMNIEK